MGNLVIFQILGRSSYQLVEYSYKNYEEGKYDLLSKYLKDKVFKDADVALFVPASLFANYESIRETFGEYDLKPIPSLGTYDFSQKFFEAMHSFGFKVDTSYSVKDIKEVRFDFSPEFIYQYFLSELIGVVLNNRGFIIDVSTAHNVYVYNIMRAAIKAVELYCLANIEACRSGKRPQFSVAYSDPIIGDIERRVYHVYIEPIDANYFFRKPFGYGEMSDLVRNVSKISGNGYDYLSGIVERALIHYNAILFNIPIALFYEERDKKERIKSAIGAVNRGFKSKIKQSIDLRIDNRGSLKVYSELDDAVYFDAYNKYMELLFIYLGISNLLNSLGIPEKPRREVPLNNLRKLKVVYERFNLPVHWNVLLNEIEKYEQCSKEIKEKINLKGCRDKIHEGWDERLKQQRNFLAHAGFEYNETFLNKRGKKVVVSYGNKAKGLMDDILKEKIKQEVEG